MKLIINNKKFEFSNFDDISSIFNEYALSIEKSLPSYFRTKSEIKFVPKEKIVLKDVRNLLSKISLENFDENLISKILFLFPNLRKKEIGYLWVKFHIIDKNLTDFDSTILRKYIDYYEFSTNKKSIDSVERYLKEVELIRKSIESRIEKKKKIFLSIENFEEIETSDFTPEVFTFRTKLKFLENETILDVFNKIKLSIDIPFVIFSYKSTFLYKVSPTILPPNSWIQFIPPQEGIFFKILNVPYSMINFNKNIENIYSEGHLSSDFVLRVNYKVNERIEIAEIIDRFIRSTNLQYEIVENIPESIRGYFSILNIPVNRIHLLDMIFTNKIFSYFMLVNESLKDSLNKKRFYVFFNSKGIGCSTTNALALTFLSLEEQDVLSTRIKISKAKDLTQIYSCINILKKLFFYYLELEPKINKIYKKYIRNFDSLSSKFVKKIEKKEQIKTGKRALDLRKLRPDIFVKRYPDVCQKRRHPYLIDENSAKEIEKKYGKYKVMNWPTGSNDWYACEPREPDDKTDDHIYPGLIENKKIPELRETYPYLPCCFKKEQFTGSTNLSRYLKGVKKIKEKGLGYILGSNKIATTKRKGRLPYYVEKLVLLSGYNELMIQSKLVPQFLRKGIELSPSSLVMALKTIFNDQRSVKEIKDEIVKNLKRYLIYSISETIGFTFGDIESILKHNGYIEPEIFISIFELFYKCNIYVFVYDEKNPDGNLMIPRHKIAYLPRKRKFSKNILLSKYSTIGEVFPYQIEPIMDIEKEKFIFSEEDQIIKSIQKAINTINFVNTISSKSLKLTFYKYK